MLVLDPSRRYTVEDIKSHRWMLAEPPHLLPGSAPDPLGPHRPEPNEQILRLMQSLGIDSVKTRDVSRGETGNAIHMGWIQDGGNPWSGLFWRVQYSRLLSSSYPAVFCTMCTMFLNVVISYL